MSQSEREMSREEVLQFHPDINVEDLLKSHRSAAGLLRAIVSRYPAAGVRRVLSQPDGAEQLKDFGALAAANTILLNPQAWLDRLATHLPWGEIFTGREWPEKQPIFRTIMSHWPQVPRSLRYDFLSRSTEEYDHVEIVRSVYSETSLLLRDFAEQVPPNTLDRIRQTPSICDIWVRELEKRSGTAAPYERVCEGMPESHVRLVLRDLLRPATQAGFVWLTGAVIEEELHRETQDIKKR